MLLSQRYRVVDDYDRTGYPGQALSAEAQNLSLTYDRSTRVRRELSDAGIILGKNFGVRTELDLGANYSREKYEANSLSEITRIDFKTEAAYRFAEKTSVLLVLNAGVEQNDKFGNDANSFSA